MSQIEAHTRFVLKQFTICANSIVEAMNAGLYDPHDESLKERVQTLHATTGDWLKEKGQ